MAYRLLLLVHAKALVFRVFNHVLCHAVKNRALLDNYIAPLWDFFLKNNGVVRLLKDCLVQGLPNLSLVYVKTEKTGDARAALEKYRILRPGELSEERMEQILQGDGLTETPGSAEV